MSQQLLVWGTYDLGKPRVRILLRGLRECGVHISECHADVWAGIEDKSQLRGKLGILRRVLRWLAAYPPLIYEFLRAPRHATVLIPYMGHLDILVLWPFARIRGTKIIWDVFISLYNTVVEDRALVSKGNPVAWAVYAVEWLATRAADRVVLDTRAHADFFAHRYQVSAEKLEAVFVGAEQHEFPRAPPVSSRDAWVPLKVLFYGQFIPLHGIPTIIRAAQQLDDGSVQWTLIGQGQEAANIRRLLAERPVRHLRWLPWVPYRELIEHIASADVCLGIFSQSEKAARVIPNKVFQVISVGRPLITRDSAAIAELIERPTDGIYLVPPDDARALVAALINLRQDLARLAGKPLYDGLRQRISTQGIGRSFCDKLL
jgi:glycosyltransferase involved in cell wall biosynthesis